MSSPPPYRYRESLELRRRLSPEGADVAIALNDLAEAERLSGDFAAASGTIPRRCGLPARWRFTKSSARPTSLAPSKPCESARRDSDAFEQGELWRFAADFKTNAGKQLDIKLTLRALGVGELEVYFDPAVDGGEDHLQSCSGSL